MSFETITTECELADAPGGDLHLAVIDGDVEEFAEGLDHQGVDVVHTVSEGEE